MKQLHEAVPKLELPFKPGQDDLISKISHTFSAHEGTKLSQEKTTYIQVFTGCLEQKRPKCNTWCASTLKPSYTPYSH